MAKSSVRYTVCLYIMVLLPAITEGQSSSSGVSPYGLDPSFIRDPFYNPNANRYYDFNSQPEPARLPSPYVANSGQLQTYPNPNPPAYPSNTPPSHYNPNPDLNYYNPNPKPNPSLPSSPYYNPNSGNTNQYAYVTAPPPTTTPLPAFPPSPKIPVTSASQSGGMEYEVDDPSKRGGPVFNSQWHSAQPAQPVQPALPVRRSWATDTGEAFGSGRLYSLPLTADGRGLLESIGNPYHYRQSQQGQQQPFNFFGSMAVNPLLFALALAF